MNELNRGRDDITILENEIKSKEERHKAELDNLKTSFKHVEHEHVSSIKRRMETSFQEKIIYQVKAKQLAGELERKNKEIENLKKRGCQ